MFILAAFSYLLGTIVNVGQPAPLFQDSAPQLSSPETIPIGQLPQYFTQYIQSADIKKTPFETDQQYQNRLPKDWSADKQVVLKIGYDTLTTPETYNYSRSDEVFSYDLKSSKLSLFFGLDRLNEEFVGARFREKNILAIDSLTTLRPSYQTTNKFGVPVTVGVTDYAYFCLRIQNYQNCASVIDARHKRFKFEVQKSPQDAQALSNSCIAEITIHPIGVRKSQLRWLAYHEPEHDEQYKYTEIAYIIDCEIQKIVVKSRNTDEVIASFEAK